MNFEEKKTGSDSRMDEIKKELYSVKGYERSKKRTRMKSKDFDIKNAWGDKELLGGNNSPDLFKYEKKGPTVFSLLLIFSILFFVVSAAFSAFYLFFSVEEKVKETINMSITGPNSVKSGQVLEFYVKLDNSTDLDYEDVEFIIDYPKSTIDEESGQFVKSKSIESKEDLLSGGTYTEKIRIILSGIKGEEKDIRITSYFKPKGYSSVLSSKKIYTIGIEESPVAIEINDIKEVLSGKDFEITLSIVSNSSTVLKDLIINSRYPESFKIISTEPKAIFSETSQNVFEVKELKPGETKKVVIKGKILGQNNDKKFFFFEIGDSIPETNEMRTLFAKSDKEISIKKPDISLVINSDKDSSKGYIVALPKEKIKFNTSIINNLSSIISNLEIVASIEGDYFEEDQVVSPRGFYDSNINKITWDKNTDGELSALIGSKKIEESFSFPIIEFKKLAGYVKDPKIILSISAGGTNFDNPNSKGNVLDIIKKEIRIATQVGLSSRVTYHDGPFDNIGETLPKVGEKTTYTVEWKIYNSNSDIKNVQVKAKLPPYVKFLNNVSPAGSYLTYDEESREVTWSYKKIHAFIGYRTDPKTVHFQIEFTPSATQIGSKPILVYKKELIAEDEFVDRKISITSEANNTSLSKDHSSDYKDGTVVSK